MIGLGTAAIGRPQYINIRSEESEDFDLNLFRERGIGLLEDAYKSGVRYFDTAPGYGMAEQMMLVWLASKEDSSIEVATKWGYSYVANFDPNATVHEIKDHSLLKLEEQWKNSKRLFPFLSTYQIHSATFDTGVLDNTSVLNKLHELKQTHHLKIGLTTTGNNQLEVIRKALDVEINGNQLFEVYQVTYNILDQSLAEISEELVKESKRLVIKEALANGRVFRNSNYLEYSSLYDALEMLAKKYNVGVDAVVLSFCNSTVKPYAVLSGASTEKQLKENLLANQFELEEEDIELLKSFKRSPNHYWSERKKLMWN